MNDLERLVTLEEIKLLRTRYSRLLDSHRWDELTNVLAPDAVLDLSPAAAVLGGHRDGSPTIYRGRDAIIAFMEKRYRNRKKILHIATIPEIEFDDDTNARGIWRQETYIKEAVPEHEGSGIAYGTVFDTYAKIDGKWFITSVQVTLDLLA